MNCAATAQLAFEYDVSKHLLVQIVNTLASIVAENRDEKIQVKMVNNGLTYMIQEALGKCQAQLAHPKGNKEQRDTIGELLYQIFDLCTDFLICKDSCMSILRNETIVRSVFEMALTYHKEWSASLNLSVVGMCRAMTDNECATDQDRENFSEWGLPQVLLT